MFDDTDLRIYDPNDFDNRNRDEAARAVWALAKICLMASDFAVVAQLPRNLKREVRAWAGGKIAPVVTPSGDSLVPLHGLVDEDGWRAVGVVLEGAAVLAAAIDDPVTVHFRTRQPTAVPGSASWHRLVVHADGTVEVHWVPVEQRTTVAIDDDEDDADDEGRGEGDDPDPRPQPVPTP